MKRCIFFLTFLITCALLSPAQSYSLEDLVKFKQDTIGKVYVSKIKSNQIYIPMDFNSSDLKDLSAYREIRYYSFLKVELVYSAYKKSEYFNQPALNVERLKSLQAAAPEIFASSMTKWKFTAQVNCKSEDEARNMFHGFIITYRPEISTPYTDVTFKSIDYTVEKYVNPDFDKIIHKVGYTKFKSDLAPEPPTALDLRDSAVLTTLKRNKDWKDVPIVCDATGSMIPYIAQTLIWFKLNCKATNAGEYSFFNDGDNKPDEAKVIGKTGGIYIGRETIYDSVESALFVAMRNGSGGDSPENNIEALLKTIDKYPNCKELVMIVDNLANVKDIELLPKVKKPVHVILCGAQTGINADYLNIARATKGTIHTIESDITDLVSLNEGEYFVFRGQKFKVVDGKFKLVFDM